MKIIRTVFSCAGFLAVSTSEIPQDWSNWTDEEKQSHLDALNLNAIKFNATSNSEVIDMDI